MITCLQCQKPKVYMKGLCRNCYERQRPPNTFCRNCDKPMFADTWIQKHRKHICCSPQCGYEHRRNIGAFKGENNPAYSSAVVICEICGKQFSRHRYAREQYDHQYCSRICARKGQLKLYPTAKPPIERPCDYCGEVLVRQSWQFRERAFCNHSCFAHWKSDNWTAQDNPAWRSGYERYYGPNWIRQSRRARERDGHTCQRCGVTEAQLGKALDVHHIIRFGDFTDYQQANLLSNLLCLCHTCHMLIEHGK